MPQYLVAIHHPDNYDPSAEDRSDGPRYRCTQRRDGSCPVPGSSPAACNRRPTRNHFVSSPAERLVITDGPYLETKEHIGGFWILDAANMDEAVA